MTSMRIAIVAAALTAITAPRTSAAVLITEWMYNPLGATNGEYVELTNLGAAPVDLTGWSMDDNSQLAGSFSLSGLGTLAPGESAVVTEPTAAAFRTEWNLASSVKVLGENTQNLGRMDEINIYDAANALVDRLTYDDQGTGNVDGPRTQGISGNPPSLAVLGTNNPSLWVLSAAGDAYGSYASASADIGNPGKFSLIPEPAAATLATIGLALVARRRRK
jgi:predicted extracellular nuclease